MSSTGLRIKVHLAFSSCSPCLVRGPILTPYLFSFQSGDSVLVTGVNKVGVIRFIGTTKFKPGKWIGIELDHPGGKNGTIYRSNTLEAVR